jgi:hypothetical protein
VRLLLVTDGTAERRAADKTAEGERSLRCATSSTERQASRDQHSLMLAGNAPRVSREEKPGHDDMRMCILVLYRQRELWRALYTYEGVQV